MTVTWVTPSDFAGSVPRLTVSRNQRLDCFNIILRAFLGMLTASLALISSRFASVDNGLHVPRGFHCLRGDAFAIVT
jgi:hypothetical protein